MKHVLLVHGRATKPPAADKERLVLGALVHGLERVNPQAAEAVRSKRVATTLAYYGDISNDLILRAEPQRREHMIQQDGKWYEPPDSYDQDLARLFARPTDMHTAG